MLQDPINAHWAAGKFESKRRFSGLRSLCVTLSIDSFDGKKIIQLSHKSLALPNLPLRVCYYFSQIWLLQVFFFSISLPGSRTMHWWQYSTPDRICWKNLLAFGHVIGTSLTDRTNIRCLQSKGDVEQERLQVKANESRQEGICSCSYILYI